MFWLIYHFGECIGIRTESTWPRPKPYEAPRVYFWGATQATDWQNAVNSTLNAFRKRLSDFLRILHEENEITQRPFEWGGGNILETRKAQHTHETEWCHTVQNPIFNMLYQWKYACPRQRKKKDFIWTIYIRDSLSFQIYWTEFVKDSFACFPSQMLLFLVHLKS